MIQRGYFPENSRLEAFHWLSSIHLVRTSETGTTCFEPTELSGLEKSSENNWKVPEKTAVMIMMMRQSNRPCSRCANLKPLCCDFVGKYIPKVVSDS